jgi:hypothetical protein
MANLTSNKNIQDKLSTQTTFFSFSSSVFLKTSKNVALYISSKHFNSKHAVIDIFVTSLADAIGDAYTLTFSNTASNLQKIDINLIKNFFLAFISKFSTGIMHTIFYFLDIPIQYILALDLILFYATINYGTVLMDKDNIDISNTKLFLIQNIFATFFLGVVIFLTKVFVNVV